MQPLVWMEVRPKFIDFSRKWLIFQKYGYLTPNIDSIKYFCFYLNIFRYDEYKGKGKVAPVL
jgi:hypothetical protein